MDSQKFVRKKALPLGWCLGCGLNSLFYVLTEVFSDLNLVNAVIVSGIGCTGRGAGYFNLDSVHGLHGRAIPLAVGVKKGNPKFKVIVFSGDGDLLGIGLGHLVHSARRNDNITVICNSNEVFGMTGGQVSPTTRIGGVTKTTPLGNIVEPINVQAILSSNKHYFYARLSPVLKDHLKKCLKEALRYKGFSFVEVISPCIVNYARKMGYSAADVFKEIKEKYKIKKSNKILDRSELGIIRK